MNLKKYFYKNHSPIKGGEEDESNGEKNARRFLEKIWV